MIVIDLVTTINRKNFIINEIRKKRAQQKPVVAMYSLMVIFDEKVGQFCIDLIEYRKKQDEEKKAKRNEVIEWETPTIEISNKELQNINLTHNKLYRYGKFLI